MSTRYFVITSSEYTNYENSLDQLPSWNLDNSKCVIEVPTGFTVTNYIRKFRDSGEFKSWRNHEDNWRDWETEAYHNGTDLDDF